MPTDDQIFLGIDVGGTDVKVGLVDSGGQLRGSDRVSTPSLKTPDNIFQFAMDFAHAKCANQNLAGKQLAAVGAAVPGVLDSKESVLREVNAKPNAQPR